MNNAPLRLRRSDRQFASNNGYVVWAPFYLQDVLAAKYKRRPFEEILPSVTTTNTQTATTHKHTINNGSKLNHSIPLFTEARVLNSGTPLVIS